MCSSRVCSLTCAHAELSIVDMCMRVCRLIPDERGPMMKGKSDLSFFADKVYATLCSTAFCSCMADDVVCNGKK